MVKLFTTPACSYCYVLKHFLEEHDIELQEFDVSKDAEARKEMIQKSGQMEVPVVEINGEIVVGFNKKEILRLLNIQE